MEVEEVSVGYNKLNMKNLMPKDSLETINLQERIKMSHLELRTI